MNYHGTLIVIYRNKKISFLVSIPNTIFVLEKGQFTFSQIENKTLYEQQKQHSATMIAIVLLSKTGNADLLIRGPPTSEVIRSRA